jgi:uncharacterized protein (DUF433 family)
VAHNTSIPKSRKGPPRLPFETTGGDEYSAPGPVRVYRLSDEERKKYPPIRPTWAEVAAAHEAGWTPARLAQEYGISLWRARKLLSIYVDAVKEMAPFSRAVDEEAGKMEDFEVYATEAPAQEDALEEQAPVGEWQVEAGEQDQAVWVPPVTLYEGHPSLGRKDEDRVDGGSAGGEVELLDPIECVRRGLPLERARIMRREDLTPEVAVELLRAGLKPSQIARLYGYASASSLREKMARWGVWQIKRVKVMNEWGAFKNELARLEEKMVPFEAVFSGLACPWLPGVTGLLEKFEARVGHLESLYDELKERIAEDLEVAAKDVRGARVLLEQLAAGFLKDGDGRAARAAGDAVAAPEPAAQDDLEARLARLEEQYDRVMDMVSRLAAGVAEASGNARAARLFAEDVQGAVEALKDEYGRHRHQVGPGHWSSRPEV